MPAAPQRQAALPHLMGPWSSGCDCERDGDLVSWRCGPRACSRGSGGPVGGTHGTDSPWVFPGICS